MNSATLLLAFSAGMVAAINPCGFALLPAYVSYYLGLENADPTAPRASAGTAIARALWVSVAMTTGFLLVFGAIGAAWGAVSGIVGQRLPWVVVGLGFALVGLGIAMVAGFVPVIRLPKLATSSGSQSAWSAFVFGVSYGVASLSCAIGPFIGTVTTTFRRHDLLTGATTFLLYGLGMGAIITILTVAVSFAQQGIVARLRRLLPHMGRVSGVLLILSGVIAAYYGWYEARILTGGRPDNRFARTISGWRDDLARAIGNVGEERIGLAIAVVLAAAAAITAVVRRGSAKDAATDPGARPGTGDQGTGQPVHEPELAVAGESPDSRDWPHGP